LGLKVALIEPAVPLYCPTATRRDADAGAALPKFLADCGCQSEGVISLDKERWTPDVASPIGARPEPSRSEPRPTPNKRRKGKEKDDRDDAGGGGGGSAQVRSG
jgi:hypothetical protein